MSKKHTLKPVAVFVGGAFAAGLAMSPLVNAASASNPFAMQEMSHGYMQVAENAKSNGMEGKCGEGKCGNQMQMQKNMEGNCGTKKTAQEGKCGEGKCGSNKNKPKPMNEGKCGGNK